jgi:putative ABC transport system permease protein
MNEFVLIRKNLFRKKLRAVLLLVSIIIAFAIFGVLTGSERAFNGDKDAVDDDRLIVVNKISFTQPLPVAYYNRIRQTPGVKEATYLSWFAGYFRDPKNSINVFAVEPQTWTNINVNYYNFPPEMRQAFIRDRASAMVGEDMARKWGWKVGDHIPISSSVFMQKSGSRTWDVTIAGVFTSRKRELNTNLMIFQWDYLNESRAIGKDNILWMPLKTVSPSVNDRVSKDIDALFANSSDETSTDTDKAFRTAFAGQFGNIALVVQLVIGTAFLTILMIVGNTMIMAVRERTKEIGVLKALGFSSGRVLRLVLGESLLLALFGGIPGIAIAALVTWYLRDVANVFPGVAVTPAIALSALGLMLCLGIATGAVPARNAFRLKIAEALERG